MGRARWGRMCMPPENLATLLDLPVGATIEHAEIKETPTGMVFEFFICHESLPLVQEDNMTPILEVKYKLRNRLSMTFHKWKLKT